MRTGPSFILYTELRNLVYVQPYSNTPAQNKFENLKLFETCASTQFPERVQQPLRPLHSFRLLLHSVGGSHYKNTKEPLAL